MKPEPNEMREALFARIERAGADLRRIGDRATPEFREVEKKLVEINPGVSAWVPLRTSRVAAAKKVATRNGTPKTAIVPREERVSFGFCRDLTSESARRWGLAIRRSTYELKGEESTIVEDELKSVFEAPLELKLMACRKIDELLQAVLDALNAEFLAERKEAE